jgi:hypothetical protein
MRDYGKVYSTFWSSETTQSLSDDGRLLALYLITCSHNTIAGVFRLPDGYVAEDMKWETARVQQAFAELLAKGFANRCETTKWVWVIKHLEWNKPENPNQRKSAAKIAQSVPDTCSWKACFIGECGESLGLEVEKKANPSATVEKPFLNQEQEQEQDIGAPSAKSPRGTALPKDWTLPDDWKAWAARERPDVDVATVADSFRDFWIAKPGKDGRKADWQATWRNWVRNQRAQTYRPPTPQSSIGSFV